MDGRIVLIDEVHTCDSSRYWLKETYERRMKEGKDPDKLDKDCVRDWVKSVCDPYKDPIPEIPEKIISKAYHNYKYFYHAISSVDTQDVGEYGVVILAGE